MSRIIAILVLVAVATASPALQTRQDCVGLSAPQRCVDAATAFSSRLGMITGSGNTNPDQLRQVREAYLDNLPTLCSAECLNLLVRVYECTMLDDLANFTQTGICGQTSGVYCPVRILDLAINQTSIVPTCAIGGSCDADCKETVSSLRSQLGCCTASWYGEGFAPLSTFGDQFSRCNVTVGAFCSGAGMHYLSVTLLFVAAVVAMIIS